MISNSPFFKTIRILLLPIALLVGLYIFVRNRLYNKGILRSAQFNLPLIGVGNLAVGGTGKSPMVELIIRLLNNRYHLATLSRGYKRKTKGYAIATSETTALEIGDEPMQFHLKFPEVAVAVGEERLVALPQLLQDRPEVEVVILDDVFQHRPIQAGLNILLTDFSNLYTRDWFLPTGDLRDERASAKRADVIVVTKCPPQLTENQKTEILKELNPHKAQQVFFSCLKYGNPYHLITGAPLRQEEPLSNDQRPEKDSEVLLVSGIANPAPLKQYIQEHYKTYWMQAYADHHIFTIDDLKEIKKKFEQIQHHDKCILTTEKDAVRLRKFGKEVESLPFFVLPVEHQILFGQEQQFQSILLKFIEGFSK